MFQWHGHGYVENSEDLCSNGTVTDSLDTRRTRASMTQSLGRETLTACTPLHSKDTSHLEDDVWLSTSAYTGIPEIWLSYPWVQSIQTFFHCKALASCMGIGSAITYVSLTPIIYSCQKVVSIKPGMDECLP